MVGPGRIATEAGNQWKGQLQMISYWVSQNSLKFPEDTIGTELCCRCEALTGTACWKIL